MTRVSDSPKIYYRAVAAKKSDPLGENYKQIVGNMGKNIGVGYLHREGDKWLIRPAKRTPAGGAYCKVKGLKARGRTELHPDVMGVHGLIPLDDPNYRVQYHNVVIVDDPKEQRTGCWVKVRSPKSGERPSGVLVCTGNMAESGEGKQGKVSTNRRNFVFVYEASPSEHAIQIDPQAIIDYRDGLTPFQKEAPFDPSYGCLVEGRPVFYVKPRSNEKVRYFGHAPFSRIAATLTEHGQTRAVTPADFVPPDLRDNSEYCDFAEAMFGLADSNHIDNSQGGDGSRSYAGRVNVTDAWLSENRGDVFEEEITPPILASPKPTTFQHYLEQPKGVNTNSQNLYHYDSDPTKVRIRGHKLYWRQRMTSQQYRTSHQQDASPNSTQHTRLRAIKPGVKFSFRVTFENLTGVELGALAWVLKIGAEDHHPNARHMLGLGKPFGMGVVRLDSRFVVINRRERYSHLFSNGYWADATKARNIDEHIRQFEVLMEQQLGNAYQARMKELLIMLEARELSLQFTYMSIEPNEFKDRPVLPWPSEVVSSAEKGGSVAVTAVTREARPSGDKKRQKVEKEIQVGDEIQGVVFDNPSSRDLWFITKPDFTGGTEYEAYIPQQHIKTQRKEGETVKAKISQILNTNPITLICEQIDTKKR
ncbi:TIGR03986 family CRISPR-associated RAMP protein [bacterium]|nr:TIGR03986 family CRISPR-associated RAMP protein [bacterium]